MSWKSIKTMRTTSFEAYPNTETFYVENVVASRELFQSVAVLEISKAERTTSNAHIQHAPSVGNYIDLVKLLF
jgi:hypothetical protein